MLNMDIRVVSLPEGRTRRLIRDNPAAWET